MSLLYVQATELADGGKSIITQENLTFADAGFAGKIPRQMTTFKPDSDESAYLGDYLSRPVAINTFTWAEGSTTYLQQQIKPWTLFFNTPSIKNKLTNYARLRCKLNLKFVVNASPFYFGAMRVAYCPIDGGIRDSFVAPVDQIKFSQMPGDFLYPADMTTFEMELPFLWPHAWLDTNSLADFNKMGQLSYILYSKLRSANGTTSSNVTITCYAWASDVELAGLTTGLVLQSDEYETEGVISGPATAVANIASKLTSVPMIGDLARATEMGANMVSGVAAMFGYSNPPVIEEPKPFVPKSFHAFANTEIGFPMDKLTIDPKNEVTVDKTVTGAGPEDELAISHFAGRKSFISGSLWTDAYTPGTQLFSWAVTPMHFAQFTGTGYTMYNSTPAAHVGRMFSQWRGSMVYTLRFVKSRYHTGRVQISWDPQAIPGAGAETTTVTRIVDLQYETEVDFVIPFKAQDPWLDTFAGSNILVNNTTNNPVWSYTYANGVVRVTVLNELTGPAASQELDILLFVRAGEDIQFAVPKDIVDHSFLNVQSEEWTSQPEQLGGDAEIGLAPDVCTVTTGETIASLRTLLHRTSFHSMTLLGDPYASAGTFFNKNLMILTNLVNRFPVDYGFNQEGSSWAEPIIGTGRKGFQFSPQHPINWVTNCFAGYRGGIVHQFNVIANGQPLPDGLKVERNPRTNILTTATQARTRFTTVMSTSTASTLASQPMNFTLGVRKDVLGTRGMALTNTNTQSGLSVVSPQYSKWKFRPAYVVGRDTLPFYDERESLQVSATMRCGMTGAADEGWPVLTDYVAAGVDFDPIFFICVPSTYTYSTAVVPNNVY